MSAPGSPANSGLPSNRRRSRLAILLGAVAAIIVVFIVAIGFANVIPGFHLRAGGGGGSSPPPATGSTFGVTFGESGIPSGTSWSVTFGGVTHSSTGSSVAFTEENGSYSYSIGALTGYTASPSSGTLTVAGKAISLAITFTAVGSPPPSTYSVTFTQDGLTMSQSWSVTLAGTMHSSTGATVSFTEVNGTYSYSVGSPSGYQASPPSGSLTVGGKAVSQTITFTSTSTKTYAITFNETGLPDETSWSVTLGTITDVSTGTSLSFSEANGSYSYSVGSVAGYQASPSSGTATVDGRATYVAIGFSPSTTPPGPSGPFPITFLQTGLPSNVTWEALLITSTPLGSSYPSEFGESAEGNTVEFAVPNATYEWVVASQSPDYASTPSEGNLTVSGQSVNLTVQFETLLPTSASYSVTFSETGLPAGGSWYAALNSTTTFSSTNSSASVGRTMAFAEPNGSYEFNVSASAPGYLATNETGTVTVDGAAVSVAITFAQAETVTFTERGVANGQYWELAFDGTEWETPAGTAFAFQALNGSYPFTAYSPGYRVTPSSGTVVVNGKAVSVSISFATATNYAVTFSETGLPTPSPWTAELLLDGSEFSNGSFAVSSTLSVSVPDGNYTWIVEAVIPGYLATPMTGGFAVHGLPVSQSIVFAPVLPNEELLVFTEEEYAVTGTHGAPNGTSWNVSVGGVVQSTTGMYLIFAEQNGSYAYTIGAPSGYAALPASGTLTIDSANVASIYDPAAEVYDAFYPVTDAPLHAAAPGGGPAPLGAAPAGASVSPSAAGARPAPESAVAGRPR